MSVAAYRMVKVPVKAVHDLYMTGYFANYERRYMVHVVHRSTGEAICGQRHTASWFQWCAMRIAPEYVECRKCQRIIEPMLVPIPAEDAA